VIVLGNLIRNACDAMPDGGRLTIHGRPVVATPEGGRVGGPTLDPTGSGTNGSPARFALSITDTGGGIAPEHLERIMEPLFSTKTRGLGLGLALAQEIVQEHGGDLLVSSRPGQGTTFTMVLNLADE